ncbi:uncharacterized protein [Amphiura filiformis]|uniref:uncharacterized protein n=1 Tax=Amphiura filiformis TaxID=82378 RepID=UPI003B220510
MATFEEFLPDSVVRILIDNEVDATIFPSLTSEDLHHMFPGKVGIVRKVLLVVKLFQGSVEDPDPIHVGLEDAAGNQADGDQGVQVDGGDQGDQADGEQGDQAGVDQGDQADGDQGNQADGDQGNQADGDQGNQADGDQGNQADGDRANAENLALTGLFTTPNTWPNYSDRVLGALKSGNILPDWDIFIMETAYFILRHSDIRNAGDYNEVGRLVSTRWPCINFSEHGKNPWNLFVKKLSQKIRNIRWQRKRKADDEGSTDQRLKRAKRVAVANPDNGRNIIETCSFSFMMSNSFIQFVFQM